MTAPAIRNDKPLTDSVTARAPKRKLYNEDAEIAVLSAILIEPELITNLRAVLKPASFHLARHRQMFEAMLSLDDERTRIDPISLSNAMLLRFRLDSERVTDAKQYIGWLVDAIPTTANTDYYARAVKDAEGQRELAGILDQALHALTTEGLPSREVAQHVFSKLLPLASDSVAGGYQHVRDLLWSTMQEIEGRMAGKLGMMTGFGCIDRETNGFRPGELIVIGGAEKLGKSAIALNIAMRVLRQEPSIGVGYVSAEMMAGSLVERVLSSYTGIDSRKIASGKMDSADFPRLVKWAGEIGQYPFWIDDEAEPTLEDVVARATHLKAQHPEVGFIVVDFMQLVQAHEKGQPESRELKRVAYGLKGLAKRTGTVVLAPCQINTKEVEDLKDMRPRLKDLQGSSGMRQAADFIGLAYREGLYNETAPNANELEIFFAACRRTPKFMARFHWEAETLTIREKGA